MTRRLACCALTAALLSGLAAGRTSRAQETEINGHVDGLVSLSLRNVAPDRVRATVTATIPRTALSVSQPGRPSRTLGAYPGPVTRARATLTASAGQQTITFGTQTP
jgi:hypothetical protein